MDSRDEYERLKRAVDVLASAGALVLLGPALVAVGVAVRLDSPGPALFGQVRVGRDWQTFKVWKFRTMSHRSAGDGPAVTSGHDGRVTPMGRLLRRSKVDELPQLWNVLIGEMSLVGPRPEVAKFVNMFREDYESILKVRPGLTDYAALAFRMEEDLLLGESDVERAYVERILPAKILLYRRYLRERSMVSDLRILARTIREVLHW